MVLNYSNRGSFLPCLSTKNKQGTSRIQSEAILQENNGINKQPLKVSNHSHENSRTAHASAGGRTHGEGPCVAEKPSWTAGTDPVMKEVRGRCDDDLVNNV